MGKRGRGNDIETGTDAQSEPRWKPGLVRLRFWRTEIAIPPTLAVTFAAGLALGVLLSLTYVLAAQPPWLLRDLQRGATPMPSGRGVSVGTPKPTEPNVPPEPPPPAKISVRITDPTPGATITPTVIESDKTAGYYLVQGDSESVEQYEIYPLIRSVNPLWDRWWFQDRASVAPGGKWQAQVWMGSTANTIQEGNVFDIVAFVTEKELSSTDRRDAIRDLRQLNSPPFNAKAISNAARVTIGPTE